MSPVILWVLVSLGHDPRPVQTFDTHGQCVQAIYDYTPKVSGKRAPKQPLFRCRQQVTSIPRNR